MNNRQVAHLWANQAKPRGRGSNFYFEGPTLYSYGSHFVVGRIVHNKRGQRAYLLNSDNYTPSTGRHQSYARRALILGATRFNIPGADDNHARNRDSYKRTIAEALKRMAGRRREWGLRHDMNTVRDAVKGYNDYSAFFSLRGRIKCPNMAEAEARAARYEAAEAAREAAHDAEWEAGAPERARLQAEREAREAIEQADKRQAFRDGAPRTRGIGGPVMLRLQGDTFQTSHGADVPRAEGVAMLQFIADVLRANDLPFLAGGTVIQAGGFTLREIRADAVLIGCHVIPMAECAAMAALVGVPWPVQS